MLIEIKNLLKVIVKKFRIYDNMNSIYFISGHGYLTYEDWLLHYKSKLDKVLSNKGFFILGDYKGCDVLCMEYLKNKTSNVTICHMFDKPRYLPDKFNSLVKNWEIIGNFVSDESRDTYMTNNSDFDIAYVKEGGDISGTAKNINRRKCKE